jgi:signal transduction histidine kinase
VITEDPVKKPENEAPVPPLEEIERQRRHLWATASIALIVISLIFVLVSYWTEVLPDHVRRSINSTGARYIFLGLSVGFVFYALARERTFRGLTRRLIAERERAAALHAHLQQEQAVALRLSEVDRARADVVATITHELKTPLTSLLGYASILRKRADTLSSDQRAEFVGVIETQGQRILRLIEDLLQSTRLEAGIGRLQRVPLDLAGIVRLVSHEISTGRQRNIKVDAPDHDLGLFGDPAAMEHVVTNLIDNALKYSSADTSVTVTIFGGEGEVLFTVADEGVGIDPSDLPTIFERFQQASNARGRASVGLGLYIVHSLVHAQGGRVWVDSEVGKGTTFTVALPRRR